MGKMRCGHCGSKVDSGFDYCPKCGSRLEPELRDGRSGRGRLGCIITFFVMVIACAVAATLWLVREQEISEADRIRGKYVRDSIKASEMARLRMERERTDSLRMVEDSLSRRRQLLSQFFVIGDFVVVAPDGGARLRDMESVQRRLRERGYATLHRGREPENVVMGLNVELSDGRISGHGDLFSAAGLWSGRTELMFSALEDLEDFISGARRLGFRQTDGTLLIGNGESRIELRDRGATVVELCVCRGE